MDNLVIRPIEESDMEALSAIEAESFSMPWSLENFRDLLNHDYSICLVALIGDQVVGSCEMSDLCHEGNINNVVVASDFRGKGIAHSLIEEMIRVGDARGIESYTLEVRVSNAPAIKVYSDFGFVSEGVRPKFYEKPVEDALIMWRR